MLKNESEAAPIMVIVIEHGAVTNLATSGPGFTYRVIDLDVLCTEEHSYVADLVPDATGVDIEEYSEHIIKDAKGDKK